MAFNPLNPIDLLSELDENMMRNPRAWVQHFAAPELQAIPQQQPVDESAFLPQGFTQPGTGVLDALALGISQGGLPQAPRGFGGAFLSGAARGFAGARGADITRRTRQLEKAREKAAAENKRNLELTDAIREANRAAVSNAARKLRDFQLKRLEEAREAAQKEAPIPFEEKVRRERELARARASGAREGAPPLGRGGGLLSGKLPTAGERESLLGDIKALDQTEKIRTFYQPEFVGPLQGRRGSAAVATGQGLKEGEASFRAALSGYRNAVINQLSGAAVSAQEAKRLAQQIPSETDPSEVFEAKLAIIEAGLKEIAAKRRKLLQQTGVDLSGIDPLPGQEPLRQSVPQPQPSQDDIEAFIIGIGGRELP